jgi:hypothetical protein
VPRHAVIIDAHERSIVARTTADFEADDCYNWVPDTEDEKITPGHKLITEQDHS